MSAVLFLVAFVVGLDEFLLAPMLTPIGQDLHAAPERVALMVAAYNLPLALCAPVFGRLSDRFGRFAVLRPALAAFALASILTALAPTLPTALAARVLTGIAAAGMLPVAFALASEATDGPGAISRVQSGLTLGIILGPLNGALAQEIATWRGAFVVLGLVAAILAVLSLHVTAAPAVAQAPILSPRAALRRALPGIAAMSFGLGTAIGVFALLGERFRDIFGWTTGQVAIVLTLFGALTVAGNLLAPVLIRRHGEARTAALGLCLVLAGILVLFIPAAPGLWIATSGLAVWAVLGGAAAPALQSFLADGAGAHRGVVLAVGSSAMNLGVAFASAAAGALHAMEPRLMGVLACLTLLPSAMVLLLASTPEKSAGGPGAKGARNGRIAAWRARARTRKMLRSELLLQPDEVLSDAGWTRDTAERESRKPFWSA